MKLVAVILTVFMSFLAFASSEKDVLSCEGAEQIVTITEGSGYTIATVKKDSVSTELLCQGDLASGCRCSNGEVVVTAYRTSVQFDYIAEIAADGQIDLAICAPL